MPEIKITEIYVDGKSLKMLTQNGAILRVRGLKITQIKPASKPVVTQERIDEAKVASVGTKKAKKKV